MLPFLIHRDLRLVQYKFGDIVADLYALESMIYLTTGIIDQYDNPQVDLECAICKAFSQDILMKIAKTAINLMGTEATMQECIQDAFQLNYTTETSDTLKRYVARVGLQHCLVNR